MGIRPINKPVQGEDGFWDAGDGCDYDSPAAAMYYATGLCGCGNPEGKYWLMCEVVRMANAWSESKDQDRPPCVGKALCALLESDKDARDNAAQFILDVMDGLGLLEHGGSSWCSWATGLGDELLKHESEDWDD